MKDRLRDRVDFLMGALEKDHPDVDRRTAKAFLICDSCQMRVTGPLSILPDLLESGWIIGELGGKDLCPGCRMYRS